ncbi:MAG TPA: hypothetical protein VJ833_02740 [Rhodanobacteraceae bacterium]|nr:hypothetical protein [Rhodanobacteraceae bacterium]
MNDDVQASWIHRRSPRDFRDANLHPRQVALPLLALALSGCAQGDEQTEAQRAAAQRGATLIARYGCGSCHAMPGIDNADGLVGQHLYEVLTRLRHAARLKIRVVRCVPV